MTVGEHLNSSSEMKKLEGVSVPHSLLPVPPAPHLKQRKLTTFLELHSLSRSRACRYGYICVDIPRYPHIYTGLVSRSRAGLLPLAGVQAAARKNSAPAGSHRYRKRR